MAAMHPGAQALADRGRFVAAVALLDGELARLDGAEAHPFREAPAAFGLETAALLEQLGTLQWHLARFRESAASLRRAQALREAHGEPEAALATIIERRAALAHHLGDDAADALFQRALAARTAEHGAESVDVAITRRNLGAYLRDRGQTRRARCELHAAMESLLRRLGRRHAETAAAHKALARFFILDGRPAEARQLAEVALDTCGRVHTPTHPFVGGALLTIGAAQRLGGSWRAAAEAIGHAEKLFAAGYGDDHPLVGVAVASMAELAVAAREIDQAVELFAEAVRIYAVTYDGHPFLADLLLRAARPLQGLGRWEESLEPLLRAMRILEPLGAASLETRRVLAFDVARTYSRLGHDAEAREWSRRATRLVVDDVGGAPR